MKIIDYYTENPYENIALDELFLRKAEEGMIGETLRFWSSEKEYFVVLGRAGKVSRECFRERCLRDNVNIIRRISGGGTVLQGPGCINYSAVLSYERDNRYRDVVFSYKSILGGVIDKFKLRGKELKFEPISDLSFDGKKVSGNAQSRKRRFFLHHGTFLTKFNTAKTSLYLKHPPEEPAYRKKRAHSDFMANLDVEEGIIRDILKDIYVTREEAYTPGEEDIKALRQLISDKYSTDKWNYAF